MYFENNIDEITDEVYNCLSKTIDEIILEIKFKGDYYYILNHRGI